MVFVCGMALTHPALVRDDLPSSVHRNGGPGAGLRPAQIALLLQAAAVGERTVNVVNENLRAETRDVFPELP